MASAGAALRCLDGSTLPPLLRRGCHFYLARKVSFLNCGNTDLFVVRMTYPLFGSPVPLLAATIIQRFL